MIMNEKDGSIDLDNSEFNNTYVENFIYRFVPKHTDEDIYSQTINALIRFEYQVIENRIKFPITLKDFSNDRELIRRANDYSYKGNKLELEPLYYLTLFVYDYATSMTVNSIFIGESRLNQLVEILTLTKETDCEITIKTGKGKVKINDQKLIDLIFNVNKIAESLTDEDRETLNSRETDLKRKSDNFSFTDRAAVFTGLLFDYFDNENSSKELISYLAYITKIVTNDSITVANDYINILLRNYKSILKSEKKKLNPLIYI